MRFERILKEAVEKYQPKIEELTDRKLGNVVVKPFYSHLEDNILESLRVGLCLSTFSSEVNFAEIYTKDAALGNPTIKFNNSLPLNLLPKRTIEYIGAHELGHLVHIKDRTLEELLKLDNHMAECVADYIATSVIGTPDIPFLKNRTYEHQGYMQGTLERLKMTFKEAFPKLGFEVN